MITLYHLENSRANRALWLLEELDLEYEMKSFKRVNGLAPEEAKEIHPLGKFPMISDNGRVIAESGAITEYLVNKAGKLAPTTFEEKLQFTYWMHYAEGSLTPLYLLWYMFGIIVKKVPWVLKGLLGLVFGKVNESFVYPNLKLHLGVVEEHLKQHDYFCGSEFTAADIQMSFPINACLLTGFVGPVTKQWLEKVESRPKAKIAYEKGGPLDFS
jgi:glutathione S-transferase